jgi:hypothetical protein
VRFGVPACKRVRLARGLCLFATGIDVIGVAAPVDLYAQVPADRDARFQGLIRRNDELAASMREKETEIRNCQKNER